MTTFAEYKKNRPADPTLVAQYKAEMQHQLDREQLAETLQQDILFCWLIQYPTEPPAIVCDEHGKLSENQCPEALRIVDAIIQAGWTAPKEKP